MKFDPTKPVQTRAGSPARIYATDLEGSRPILATIQDKTGDWYAETYGPDGRWHTVTDETRGCDLINIPREIRIELWVNVYDRGPYDAYYSREDADRCGKDRIACVHVSQVAHEDEGIVSE